MQLEMTWVDAFLMVLLASSIVLGMRRGVSMLVVALGSILLWLILNNVGLFFPPLAFFIALGAGYGVGLLARALATGPLESVSDAPLPSMIAGGIGGFLIGVCLIFALVLALPISANSATGGFNYPSERLPAWLLSGVRDSAVQRFLSTPTSRGGLGVWGNASILRGALVPDRGER
jgi:hypothetical protein